jgi:flagellar biogenesis protein FliO
MSAQVLTAARRRIPVWTRRAFALLRTVLQAMRGHRKPQQLQLRESLSLGDKRFIAVVDLGPQSFLLAGTPSSVTLLARLRADRPQFAELLDDCETGLVM